MKTKFRVLFLVIILIAFSCQDDKQDKTEIHEWNFFSIQARGEEKSASYGFCSITLMEIDYTYRVGKWSFFTKDNIKIAEGEYDLKINDIFGHGGCPYSYYYNTVDLSKWKFWNINSDEIESTSRLRELIRHTMKLKNENNKQF